MMAMIVMYMLVLRLLVTKIMAVYFLLWWQWCWLEDVGCEDGDDGPPVGGERAGLVRADRRRVAHRLARVQVPHQVVVAHHFLQNAFVKFCRSMQ